MATYIETLGKLQQQSLDALKQAQATQLAALNTIGELVSDVPAFRPAAAAENLPTFSELAELNAAFTRNVLEQQNLYASQLARVFTVASKNVTEAADRAVKTTTAAAK
ncbi:MAG TPA: hypothetical protein VHS78_16750 [Candidatus Elarobacter sp.]|jgi:predicted XRE-type DNA-binding protein|nr:hypothetical protein [Candidatus Elarobacter sp.]